MYRSICRLIFVLVLLTSKNHCFDSGLSGNEKTTHYGLTECALLRITARYLQKVYGSTHLESIATTNEICDDVETIFNEIQQETRRLGINLALRSIIDQVCLANIVVNLNEFTSSASHFHNEAFDEGSILIANRLADVHTKLMGDALSIFDARQSFGQALHTLQDFYAHSNWVELGRQVPNDILGTGNILGLYAPSFLTTCNNCTHQFCADSNILPMVLSSQYLTSGYFDIYSTSPSKPKGKCSHGGPLDVTTQTDAIGFGINKDNEHSDHGSFHMTAAKLALNATIQQLELLWSNVGQSIFGRFLGFDSSSLVIVLDTTGSMQPVIEVVKTIIVAIIEFTRGDNAIFRPSNYIFSPFNDPEWGPLIITTDPEYLINKIKNLTVDGGGDEAELFYHGLNEAVQLCEPNSIIYTFTDAPAKDDYLRSQVLARVTELKSKIYSFYARYRSLSRKHQETRNNRRMSSVSTDDDIALTTGGSTIMFDPRQDSNATRTFFIHNLYPKQSLLSITGSKSINTSFAVDGNITRIQIDLISTQPIAKETSHQFYLSDPNGLPFLPTLIADGMYFQLYVIENPRSGLWHLVSNQSYSRTIEITIPENSNTSILSTCRTTLSQKIIQESNSAYGPFTHEPTINQSDLVFVTSCNNLRSSIQSATIELVNKMGETISVWLASNVTKTGSIIFPVVIPDTDFRVLTKIKLTDGTQVQRQSNSFISPSSIQISVTNQPYTLKNNSTTSITFTISNQAEENLLIRLCMLDTLKLLGDNGTCRNYTVSSMNSIHDTLNITLDTWQEESDIRSFNNITSGSITFSITAKNNIDKEVKNYNKIPFYIQTHEYNESSPVTLTSTETQSTNTIITSITSTTSTSTTTSNAQIRFNYIYIQSYKLYLVFFILAYFYI